MLPIEPEIAGADITMIGSFNPMIFTPGWLARNKLITDQMADAAKVQIIHAEISSVELDWFRFRVDKDRFQIQTREASLVRLSDLVVNMFGGVLMHTPIWQLGISRWVHFSVGTFEIRNKIGRALAPMEPWGEWGREIDAQTGDMSGGLSTLVVEQKRPAQSPFVDIGISATVQPSLKMRQGTGVYMNVQDNCKLETLEKTIGCLDIVKKLSDSFESSIAHSETIISQIMSLKAKLS